MFNKASFSRAGRSCVRAIARRSQCSMANSLASRGSPARRASGLRCEHSHLAAGDSLRLAQRRAQPDRSRGSDGQLGE